MKQISTTTTTTYQFNDKYYIDIIEKENNFEAWVYNIHCGIKMFMAKMPKENMKPIDVINMTSDLFYDCIVNYQIKYETCKEDNSFMEDEHHFWYAVILDNEDDDWSDGSYDLGEAKRHIETFKKHGYKDAYIAVIKNNTTIPVCVAEIH